MSYAAILLAAISLGLPAFASPTLKTPKAAATSKEMEFDSTRAYRYLNEQCAFGPRNTGTDAHAQAIRYFTTHFKSLGIPLQTQEFVHTDMQSGAPVPLTNLIATVKGKDAKRAPILFCAHWDSRPRADQESNAALRDRPILGANDGASGVAVLLELANLLSRKPPAQTVFLVLFDGEDYGREGNIDEYFLGARYFAEHLPVKEFDYALLLDMIGDTDLHLPIEQNSAARNPALVKSIWDRATALGLSAFTKTPGPSVLDDHMPLLAKGIRAVDIIDFDYPAWHTLGDTPDKCSAYSLGMTGRLVASLAYRSLP